MYSKTCKWHSFHIFCTFILVNRHQKRARCCCRLPWWSSEEFRVRRMSASKSTSWAYWITSTPTMPERWVCLQFSFHSFPPFHPWNSSSTKKKHKKKEQGERVKELHLRANYLNVCSLLMLRRCLILPRAPIFICSVVLEHIFTLVIRIGGRK